MGRRTLLDAQMANQIVAILQRGLPICDACDACGITEKSYQNWYNRGERASRATDPKPDDQRIYIPFFRSCKAARATGKVSLLDTLNGIALNAAHPKQVYAITWLLERMYPMQFGRRTIRIEAAPLDEFALPPLGAGSGLPEAAVNIILEGGPVEDSGPIIDEPDEEEAPPDE